MFCDSLLFMLINIFFYCIKYIRVDLVSWLRLLQYVPLRDIFFLKYRTINMSINFKFYVLNDCQTTDNIFIHLFHIFSFIFAAVGSQGFSMFSSYTKVHRN